MFLSYTGSRGAAATESAVRFNVRDAFVGWGTRGGLGEYTFEDVDLERFWNRLCDAIGRVEDFYVKHFDWNARRIAVKSYAT